MRQRFGWWNSCIALLAFAASPSWAQDASKDDDPPPKVKKAGPKAKNKKDADATDKDAKPDDEGGFGSARPKPAGKARVLSDDKDREKMRKLISNKVPRKEKSIFVVKKIEIAQANSTPERSRTTKSKQAVQAGDQKIEFEAIAGREATIDNLLEFMYQPKEPKVSARKTRSKKTRQPSSDDAPIEIPTKRDFQIVKQFDDSKEREATDYCGKLQAAQEARDRQAKEQRRFGRQNFGDG